MRAISRNLSAQGYSQAVTLAVQLGMVPLLINVWGLERYGVWLLLTAVPAYLAFSDFGFTFVAKNEMAMRVSAGDRDGALAVFQSIFVLLVLVSVTFMLLLGSLVLVLPLDTIFALGEESSRTVQTVLLAQIGSALLYQFFLLLCAGVRCEGHSAREMIFAATARLAEAGVILAAAYAGDGLAGAALAGVAARMLALAVLRWWLLAQAPWLRFGLRHAQGPVLRRLAGPSFSYMSLPLGQALLIHGPVILPGATAAPAVVALYAVTRTVARLGMAGANMLSHAFTPEYSFARGRGDRRFLRRLLLQHLALLATGSVAYLLAAPFVIPAGVVYLSQGELAPDLLLSAVLMAGVVAEMIWTAFFTPVAALNGHGVVAKSFLLLCLLGFTAGLAAEMPVQLAALVGVVHLAMIGIAGTSLRRIRTAKPEQRVVLLALGTYGRVGGLQRFNRRLIDSLLRQAGDAGWAPNAWVGHDAPEDIPATLRGHVHAGIGLRAMGQAVRAEVLLLGHINLLPLGWLAKCANRRLRLVLFVHGVEVWGDARYRRPRWWERRMLRVCDRIASVSRFTAQRMSQTYGLAPDNMVIFPNTVDLPRAEVSAKLRRGFLTVTRLAEHDREKHVDAVLRALAQMPGQETLRVAGDGALRPGLEALAAELGIQARVRFHGHVGEDELERLYRESRVFVLPSSKEGFGIVYLEAWAHGLSVICSTEGAAPEVVRDGLDGFAVQPDDIGALSGRMAELASDDGLCERMAKAGQERMRNCYLTRHLDKNLRALLTEVG